MPTLPALPITISPSVRSTLVSGLPRRIAVGIAATLVVAVAAHVAFPLPFTPVPFTLQPLAVLCVGLFLGPVDGALAMLAYLAEGAAGVPVFSPTGPGGLAQLVGPTGGFLMAYPLVAFLSGSFRRFAPKVGPFLAAATGCLVATVVLFLLGAFWLAHITHLGAGAVFTAAVAPFLPGEAVKIVVAAGVFRAFSLHNRAL